MAGLARRARLNVSRSTASPSPTYMPYSCKQRGRCGSATAARQHLQRSTAAGTTRVSSRLFLLLLCTQAAVQRAYSSIHQNLRQTHLRTG
jgi:hypothetical protein